VWALDILLMFYFKLVRRLINNPQSTITSNLNATSLKLLSSLSSRSQVLNGLVTRFYFRGAQKTSFLMKTAS
jgi:hypothetical protein